MEEREDCFAAARLDFDWRTASDEELATKFGVLNAMYLPGPEGDGWRLGHRDALSGLPRRDPAEQAKALREDRRVRGR